MTRPTRDETMMALARTIAERSTCPRRKVGAVAVDAHGRVLAMGHNGVAMGERHCVDAPCDGVGMRSTTGLDACAAVHAESNLVAFCSDVMKIDAVYVTASPCTHCVRVLLNTSARRLVFAEEYDRAAIARWVAAGREAYRMEGA